MEFPKDENDYDERAGDATSLDKQVLKELEMERRQSKVDKNMRQEAVIPEVTEYSSEGAFFKSKRDIAEGEELKESFVSHSSIAHLNAKLDTPKYLPGRSYTSSNRQSAGQVDLKSSMLVNAEDNTDCNSERNLNLNNTN